MYHINIDTPVAFGVYGRQLYGPYTESQVNNRINSRTVYADRLVFPKEGETWDEFENRMLEEYAEEV